MKPRITIVVFAALVLSVFSAGAQIAVSGVNVGTKMTKSDVIAKFGEPDRYECQDSGDNGVNEWYHYSETQFVFKDDEFIEFAVCDNTFMVTLEGLDSDVTVGDKFSVLSPLNVIKMDWYEKDWYCVPYYDEMVSFKVKDDIIESIIFSFRD